MKNISAYSFMIEVPFYSYGKLKVKKNIALLCRDANKAKVLRQHFLPKIGPTHFNA